MTGRPSGDDLGEDVGRLDDRHAADLYRYALMVLADHAAAADVVQQVFLGVLRAGRRLEVSERYLRRAARNECYSWLRRRRREGPASDAQLLESSTTVSGDPDERLTVEQAIRVLPPQQREVVYLKVFQGLTFQEMADLSGESINTVASRYRYALEKLRERLGVPQPT